MNAAREPIRGKVARILNSRELALNIGARNGVRPGMLFEVLDPRSEDIPDPDTGEILGSIHRPKVQVKITQVNDRVSLASTFRSWKVNVGGEAGVIANFGKLFAPPEFVTTYETLKTDPRTWEELDEHQSYVKVGDPVVEVIEQAPAPERKEAISLKERGGA